MKYLKYYTNFCKKIIDQKINVIICVVGLSDEIRKQNKKRFKNYIEIYIKSKVSLIKTHKIKKTYLQKKNVWGQDLKPEFPKKPNIIIHNNFKKDMSLLSFELIKKLKKDYQYE
jgi:adenylylsulfate kinase-like enzyme